MLLQSQIQFMEDYLKPLSRGENVKLPVGYDALYAQWLEFNSEVIGRLSAEERAKSFIGFVDAEVKKRIKSLLPEEALIARGTLILASEDDGKTFDKLIKPEDLNMLRGQDYHFLSPTLRSTTTNLKELMDEQLLLHVADNLKDQNCLVENAFLQNGLLYLEIKNPKGIRYTCQVDPNQTIGRPMNYIFINQNGVAKTVPETLLPEQYGQLEPDPTLRPLSDSDRNRGLAIAGGILSSLPDMAQDLKNSQAANLAAAALTAQNKSPRVPLQIPRHRPALSEIPKVLPFDNVLESKRRLEESKKQKESEANIQEQRQEKYEEDTRKKAQEKTPPAPEQSLSQSPMKRAALAGMGIGGVLLGGLAGTVGMTMYIATIVRP